MICVNCLCEIEFDVNVVLVEVGFLLEKFCCMFKVLMEVSFWLFFYDCKFYEIVVLVVIEWW